MSGDSIEVKRVLGVMEGAIRRVMAGDKRPESTHHDEADVTLRVIPMDTHDVIAIAIPRAPTRQRSLLPPPPGHGGVGGALVSDPDLVDLIQISKKEDPSLETSFRLRGKAPNEGGRPKASHEDRVAKIPERAWKAADYIRDQLLAANPNNMVRSQKWGSTVTTGWRFTWANEIRLMVDNDGRGFTVDGYYDEIARALVWVFKGQGGTEPQYRVIVESGSALRKKFDQIRRKMNLKETPRLAAPKPSSVIPVKRKLV